jgi:four helix bundle protein
MIYNFEDLVIWQMSKDVVREVYLQFRDNHDYGFRDQIQRAAVSIMNNISEGYQRNKFSKDNKQFVYFLNISYGSCAEVRNMLYIAEEIEYLAPTISKDLRDKIVKLECKIEALINKLQSNNKA